MGEQDSSVRDLCRALNRLSLAIEGASSRAEGWEVVQDEPSSSAAAEAPVQAVPERLDHNDLALRIPPLPARVLQAKARLRGGQYSEEYRLRRAWEAGFWAGQVLQGNLSVPRASLPIDLRPTVYIILKAPGLQSPTRVSSASDLYRITGKFNDHTLCHSFPSLTEAEAYCEAAGVQLPCHHRWS